VLAPILSWNLTPPTPPPSTGGLAGYDAIINWNCRHHNYVSHVAILLTTGTLWYPLFKYLHRLLPL